MVDQAERTEKVRENRLRRMAQRQGLVLRKSRRRDPRALDYGRWWLFDARTGDHEWIPGTSPVYGYGADLDEIEEYLTADDATTAGGEEPDSSG